MTAVLQYTINEVLEGAGVLVRLLREDMKITPQILRLVIANDSELKEVFKGGILPSSGGGSYVSKKHLHQVRGTYETTDDEEEASCPAVEEVATFPRNISTRCGGPTRQPTT